MVTETRISAHAHYCQLLAKYTTTPPLLGQSFTPPKVLSQLNVQYAMFNVQKGKVNVQRSKRAGGFRTLVGYRLGGTCPTWLGGVLTKYSATELADRSTVSLEIASDYSLGSATG